MADQTVRQRAPKSNLLSTQTALRREAVALYWQTKKGDIDSQVAGRLGNLLRLIGELLSNEKIDELEARLASLEQLADRPRPPQTAPSGLYCVEGGLMDHGDLCAP